MLYDMIINTTVKFRRK